jgi:hypothetical protein
MKDLLIGTLTGVSAVLAMAWLTPKPPPALPPLVRDVMSNYRWPASDDFLIPTTQPNPTQHKLEKILEKVEVKKGRLDKLLAFIADSTGVNMAVNWRVLEAAGINGDCRVTLTLRHLPARVVLNETLRDAGGNNVKLGYTITDGIVRISTADELSHDAVTCIYDVSDLIDEAMERNRKHEADPSKPQTNAQKTMTEQGVLDSLVRMIQETIDPTVWRDAGGSVGSIRMFDKKLIVTQTEEGHEELRHLLAALRQKPRQP